jgi:23S rRNA (cytosine1962-C5)-methyltransferase
MLSQSGHRADNQVMQDVILRAGAERRVRRGFPWVYSNDIDPARLKVRDLPRGELVRVVDSTGRPVGEGFASPNGLIAVRLLGRVAGDLTALFTTRLERALAWRERLYPEPYYRWVFGEGDGLPGLVIDRHGDLLVVQANSSGMDRHLDLVIELARTLVEARGVWVKNDSRTRAAEGLPASTATIGDVPATTTIRESGVSFDIPLGAGQKTGWYYDQRDNRMHNTRLYRGARVLDLYCYLGGFGRIALAHGAEKAVCVDESAAAIEQLGSANVPGLEPVRMRVEDFLAATDERWDIVVADPPAFVQSKRELTRGIEKYRSICAAALAHCAPGGLFVSASCSAHLDGETHLAMLRGAARRARRSIAVVGRGGLPPDHPVHPLLPESAYLTCWYLRVE